jgi:hypothetical protein
MDELTLLRELDADTPPPSPRARLAARARLEHEMARETARETPRPTASRSPFRWWDSQRAAWVALALTVVGALVVVARDIGAGGDPLPPSALVRSDPAADVLELAARNPQGLALPPTPRPDQYLYIREITEAKPVDPGGTPRRFVEEEWLAMDRDVPSRSCELGRCWTALNNVMPRTPEELERIPRDPRRLLLYARARLDPSHPEGPFTENDWTTINDFLFMLLATPAIVPPDLRSALVSALAYAPDARVVNEQLEFRGRPAAVVDVPPWSSQLVVDRYTHEYLGSRWELGPGDMRGRNGRLFQSSRVRLVSYPAETAIVDRMGERP